MGLSEESRGEQGDLADEARRLRFRFRYGLDVGEGGHIGKLLVAHLHGLLQDLVPGGVGQTLGVVDRLGDGVAGDAQCVRDILNGDFLFHVIAPFCITVFILS